MAQLETVNDLLTVMRARYMPRSVEHEFADRIQAAHTRELEALRKERDELREDLAFVERWANHHGTKPHVTPAQILGVIQHYPPITAITRSYSDGVVPATRNPWAELEALRARGAKP